MTGQRIPSAPAWAICAGIVVTALVAFACSELADVLELDAPVAFALLFVAVLVQLALAIFVSGAQHPDVAAWPRLTSSVIGCFAGFFLIGTLVTAAMVWLMPGAYALGIGTWDYELAAYVVYVFVLLGYYGGHGDRALRLAAGLALAIGTTAAILTLRADENDRLSSLVMWTFAMGVTTLVLGIRRARPRSSAWTALTRQRGGGSDL